MVLRDTFISACRKYKMGKPGKIHHVNDVEGRQNLASLKRHAK